MPERVPLRLLTEARPFVVAEAGVNHNGSLDRALAMVDAAADAGADAVKFQTFRAQDLASPHAPKASYQAKTTDAGESQREMLARLELAPEAHHALQRRAKERGVLFLSTPFDAGSLDFLVRALQVPLLKVGSGDLTNGPLLLRAAASGRPVILSTGMGTLEEIEAALGVLAFGYTTGDRAAPGRAAFAAAAASAAGRAALAQNVALLHCTSQYPAPSADANLRAMGTLREAFGLVVGYSDHTMGNAVALAAVALGARIIEKHFTLDRGLPGPDHQASALPEELGALVRDIREVDAALGSPEKRPVASELSTREVARRRLTALRPVRAGEPFTEANLGAKRPGNGESPMAYWDWLGRPASRDYAEDEPIA